MCPDYSSADLSLSSWLVGLIILSLLNPIIPQSTVDDLDRHSICFSEFAGFIVHD